MTTLRDLITETRRHLLSTHGEIINELASDITDAATSLTVTHEARGIQANTLLAIGLEEMHTWSVNDKTATVLRGHNGSTAAAHTSGALIRVDPLFSDFRILSEINNELASLSSPRNGLFAIKGVDVTYDSTLRGYPLNYADIQDIYEIRAETTGPAEYWPRIKNYELSRQMDTAEFPGGIALFLHQGGSHNKRLRVRYKGSFNALANYTDDVLAVAGLHNEAHDIPPLGAAARLIAYREAQRNFIETQGETRRAEEVPPGAITGSARTLLSLRNSRIGEESGRLARLFPTRTK